ncbi:MAG: hypothetical protein F7B60_00725 [Desulfurococcales archaeon]|nr:hypothetical protein [Desulfurococcales archaeon]
MSNRETLYLTGVGGYIKGKHVPNVEVMIGAYSLRIPIVFIPYIPIELAVLGRKEFFDAFEIAFREWERKLIIKPRNMQANYQL